MADPGALNDALGEIESGNVTTGLDWHLQRALADGDVEACYLPAGEPLIRAAAAARESEVQDACARLRARYGKQFSARRFRTCVKELRAEIDSATPRTSPLILNAAGEPKAVLANAIIALEESGLAVKFDLFSSAITHQKLSPWDTVGRWRDIDDLKGANHLQHRGVLVGSATVNEAAIVLAHKSTYHPVRDWLAGLKWDGRCRLEMLACEYFGADDTPLHRRISEAWAISCVARIMRPGCQAKYMLVLESPQDESKSKALRALTNGHLDGDEGIQWFRDSLPDIDKSDIGLYMQGVWIIEVAELSAIRGKAWERTKAFISSQVDTFRVPYGRNMQDYPRQCVFAATTNEQQWGGDQTGLARFWPIRTGHIDVPAILRDRDQLWAEARTLYDEGRPWWLDTETEKLAREAQQERMPEDSVAEHVAASVDSLLANSLGDDVSVSEILTHLKWSEKDGPAVGRALTRLGYESYRPRDGATRIRRYRKKG